MKAIYKYTLELKDEQILKLPKSSKILSIQDQQGKLRLWALIDVNEKELEDRRIQILGTAFTIEDGDLGEYICTIQQAEGRAIWHIFEK